MTQNLTAVASAIPEIFKEVQNYRVGHLTLATPFPGMVCHRQAGTCYHKPTHWIWNI